MYTEPKSRFLLYGTVFITGAAVLILEVSAVRILAPIFGSSIYVLSSVLSVILLALSLGYFLGGRIADRRPNHITLYHIIAAGGISLLCFQYLIVSFVATITAITSPILGPLLFSMFLFFIPAFLLGMDSPYVIKLISDSADSKTSGAYVGTTFFWSTIGSITGSLLSGFYLIPTFGVEDTITYTALVLVILSIVGPYLLDNKQFIKASHQFYITLLTVVVATFLFVMITTANAARPDELFAYDSAYSAVRVTEYEKDGELVRQLNRNTNRSSAIYLNSYDHVYSYSQYADLHAIFGAESLLLLGGGAYTIPRRITSLHPEKEITVAELDHTLYPLAQTYFDLKHTDRVHNKAVDARVFIAGTQEKFDFVFMDAFGSSQNIPFHLTTVEFLEQLKATLTNDGVVVTNYIGMLDNEPNSLTARFMATYLSVFPNLTVYQTAPRQYDTIQNTIIVAYNDPALNPDISDFMVRDNATGTIAISELEVPLTSITSSEARLLTDNDAPTEYLTAKQLQRYLEARK